MICVNIHAKTDSVIKQANRHTITLLESSGHQQTCPLKACGYRHQLTQSDVNRKVDYFGVNSTNSTEQSIRGRTPASKKTIGGYV